MQRNKGVVIGGGTMGTHIASIFVANDHDAEIVEPDEEARENLEASIIAAAHEIGAGKNLGKVRAVASIDDRLPTDVVPQTFERYEYGPSDTLSLHETYSSTSNRHVITRYPHRCD